jgi:hypothetical protein
MPSWEHTTLPNAIYDHCLYGRCTLIAKDGVHAIIQTHDSVECGPNDENGQPTLVTEDGIRTEVHITNLTLIPRESIPAPRYWKCPECEHMTHPDKDECDMCGEDKPARKRRAPRVKTETKITVDSAVFDAQFADFMD